MLSNDFRTKLKMWYTQLVRVQCTLLLHVVSADLEIAAGLRLSESVRRSIIGVEYFRLAVLGVIHHCSRLSERFGGLEFIVDVERRPTACWGRAARRGEQRADGQLETTPCVFRTSDSWFCFHRQAWFPVLLVCLLT